METSVARLDALRVAIAEDPDAGHHVAHRATLELLDRTDRAGTDRLLVGVEHFAEAAETLVGTDRWPMKVGVMANAISLVGFAEPADFATLDALVKRYGHRAVAAVQTGVDERLGTASSMPLASRLVWNLARADEIIDGLVASGLDRDAALDVSGNCYRCGFWLVVADVDPDSPGPELATVEDAVRCADTGGIRGWRAQVAVVAANPWSPYPVELHKLLVAGDRLLPAAALEEAIKYYREQSERHDRQLVAREIRRLVAVSGLSQRQFAALCGTSAPRLSTYVNGLVTPSASMMVRFNHASARAQRQARRARDASA
ncbi:XRE family transcriptional regulator [Nocardioides immobilis]|uniref:XRE family transcriptional regulator n=1 Tax=Nocardioides immobilis TaxID=2049295 RepID=A0A417XW28_9ACTN|nr:helix-turn-helix transcriptional regulator [Nocardioides immobilis]RHW24583.1 XRE family transcriptional regulator [Nocardioides immobilis]